jgi:glucose-6-phosphate isomerase
MIKFSYFFQSPAYAGQEKIISKNFDTFLFGSIDQVIKSEVGGKPENQFAKQPNNKITRPGLTAKNCDRFIYLFDFQSSLSLNDFQSQ